MSDAGPTGRTRARIFRTGEGLRVDDFVTGHPTPGNVGLCFSGGGTRSMLATTGQLRALKALGLLEKARMTASVSGGAWAHVPFTFLPPERSDDELLGVLVPDPGALRAGPAPGSPGDGPADPTDIREVRPGSLVHVPTLPAMQLSHAAAWILWWLQPVHLGKGVPVDRLWTSYVTMTILSTLGYQVSHWTGRVEPEASFFCWDRAHEAELRARAPDLPERVHFAHHPATPERIRRPFPLVQTAMLVHAGLQGDDESFRFLAPVQVTPFFAGVVSRPDARDDWKERGWFTSRMHREEVGGGAPDAFALGSRLVDRSEDHAGIGTEAVFSLPDVVSATSAVFAERLRTRLVDRVENFEASAVEEAFMMLLGHLGGPALEGSAWLASKEIERLYDLAPSFRYWSPGARPGSDVPTPFADGGSLENIGVASMLAWEDLDSLVVFVNAGSALEKRPGGIVIDDPVPTLFGLRGEGPEYLPFPPIERHGTDELAQRRFNQVFESRRFDELRNGLMAAARDTPGRTAVFRQRGLRVLPNSWYGVRGHRKVDVLWFYLNRSRTWLEALLDPEVRRVAEQAWFPHWNTWKPEGTPAEANLLAHYTSWVTLGAAEEIRSLYASGLVPFGPRGSVRYHALDPSFEFEASFHDAAPFSEGLAAVRVGAGDGWCYLDTRGRIAIQGPFAAADAFDEGLARVVLPDGNSAVLDATGRVRLEAGEDREIAEILAVREGVALVRFPQGLAFVEVSTGHVVDALPGRRGRLAGARPFVDGLAAVQDEQGSWGWLDRSLHLLAVEPAPWLEVGDFRDGFALVRGRPGFPPERIFLPSPRATSGGIPGHGPSGDSRRPDRATRPEDWTEVRDYACRRAWVRTQRGGCYLDLSGRLAFEPFAGVGQDYSDGLAAVRFEGEGGWRYLDREGRTRLASVSLDGSPRPLLEAGPFRAGLAEVTVASSGGPRRLLVDRDGAVRAG